MFAVQRALAALGLISTFQTAAAEKTLQRLLVLERQADHSGCRSMTRLRFLI